MKILFCEILKRSNNIFLAHWKCKDFSFSINYATFFQNDDLLKTNTTPSTLYKIAALDFY